MARGLCLPIGLSARGPGSRLSRMPRGPGVFRPAVNLCSQIAPNAPSVECAQPPLFTKADLSRAHPRAYPSVVESEGILNPVSNERFSDSGLIRGGEFYAEAI